MPLHAGLRWLNGDDPADPFPDLHLINRQTPDVTDHLRRDLGRRCERVKAEQKAEFSSVDVADSRHDRLIEK